MMNNNIQGRIFYYFVKFVYSVSSFHILFFSKYHLQMLKIAKSLV